MFFNEIRRCAYILGVFSGTTAATPPPTPAAKSSLGYNSSALIFMSPKDTKYDPNSIPNLLNYNSSPIIIKLYTYWTYI